MTLVLPIKYTMHVSSRSGFTIIEVLLATGIVLTLAMGASSFFSSQRSRSASIADQNACRLAVQSVIQSIKSYDNSLLVRSWLPTREKRFMNDFEVMKTDPICSGPASPCDTNPAFELLNPKAEHEKWEFKSKSLSQNIRGAATWAQSLHNRARPAVCSTGVELSRQQLELVLPGGSSVSPWLSHVNLKINDSAHLSDCGPKSETGVNNNSQFTISVTAFGHQNADRGAVSCSGSTVVAFPRDHKPAVPQVRLFNGDGDELRPNATPGECTCKMSVEELKNDPMCGKYRDVKIKIEVDEPGVMLLCNRNGPRANRDQPHEWYSCGELQFGEFGSEKTIPEFSPDLRKKPVYSSQYSLDINLSDLPARGDDEYSVTFKVVDVGRHETEFTTSFRVQIPTGCRDPETFCGAANPSHDTCGRECPAGRNCPLN